MPSTTQWTYFAVLFGVGVIFQLLAFSLFLPVIILAPSKFALTFSVGSALILASLFALKGWQQMYAGMTSKERLPFTAGGRWLRELRRWLGRCAFGKLMPSVMPFGWQLR